MPLNPHMPRTDSFYFDSVVIRLSFLRPDLGRFVGVGDDDDAPRSLVLVYNVSEWLFYRTWPPWRTNGCYIRPQSRSCR